MNYVLNTECGLPDAKGAKVSRRTLKNTEINSEFKSCFSISQAVKSNGRRFLNFFNFLGFLSRPSRNLSGLRVRKFSPSFFRIASPL